MKKLLSILLMMVLVVSIFTACAGSRNEGDTTVPPATYDTNDAADDTQDAQDDADVDAGLKDGTYTAEADEFHNGWKDNVTIEVKDGKIASVNWNSEAENGGKDKKTASKDGDYGMVENGGASAEWHEQAEKVEAFLVEKQDVDAIQVKDDGTTDAVAGVTIKVNGFVDLVKKALSEAK
ncbi:MAG: FMN-binding protein [Clostridiales bacterium]|nr:FMN-binding protein [Clostridiales bacterium]